ncbi:MAG: IclR family transcriptional regulator, partial [Deltaproteobacteria bacterium]
CTALGKILLASQPEEEQSRIMDRIVFRSFTKKTIQSKARLIEESRKVRTQGYGVDDREHEEDVECIAAAIRDHLGNAIAALSVSGPIKKIDTPLEKKFVAEVKRAVALISSKLGYVEANG